MMKIFIKLFIWVSFIKYLFCKTKTHQQSFVQITPLPFYSAKRENFYVFFPIGNLSDSQIPPPSFLQKSAEGGGDLDETLLMAFNCRKKHFSTEFFADLQNYPYK
jgi:hypothetical protein